MTTVIQELGIDPAPGLDGPTVVAENEWGLPAHGLVHQFRFTEASLGSGVLDDIGGARYSDFGGSESRDSAAMLSGGGIRLRGHRAIQGPEIDHAKPYTVALVVTRASPASLVLSGQTVLGVQSRLAVTGWSSFFLAFGSDTIAAGEPFGAYLDHTVGEAYGPRATVARPWSAKFAKPFVLAFRAYPDNRQQLIMRTADQITLLGQAWDNMSAMGRGLPNHLLIGGATAEDALRNGDLTVDLACVWNRPISDGALQRFTERGLAIAAGRGRL